MTPSATLFLLLTAIVAALVAVLVYAIVRIGAAARQARKRLRAEGAETAFMASAVEEAVARLREQERRMHARAEASERLSNEIIASMASGLLVVDVEGRVRILNPAGRALLGIVFEPSDAPFRDVLRHNTPLAAVISECLRTERAIVRRALQMPPSIDGRPASHLGVTVSPIRDRAGSFQGAICLFTDLSAVAELEEQLRLKDSLARLGEMTAGIAHEFRNGLATIHGYSRLFDLDRVPAEYRPYIEGIRQETVALGEVVTQFLNFARPTQLTLAPVDTRVIADRAVEDIQSDVSAKGGQVRISGEFPRVDGDEILLRQAFSNLCRNAFEACAGAHVTPRIELEGTVDRQHHLFWLSVSDNGPGIDPLLGDQIFRPFFSTKAGGTGLGLALVQKIVVTHNGRITATRSPAGGARMQLALPLAAQP